MKPGIMVSSVVSGFEEAREAARRGIEDGGGDPLLVNEDFPAIGSLAAQRMPGRRGQQR